MSTPVEQIIPVLFLTVAALAVFVGPIVTYLVIKQQNATNIQVANKQIIAPIRQEWINNLRELIAEIAGKCAHYWASGYEDRDDGEYRHITELVHKLELYINPKERDHANLLINVGKMESALSSGGSPENDEKFWNYHKEVMTISQTILKSEWERVKNEM